jgi:hypothetical protein
MFFNNKLKRKFLFFKIYIEKFDQLIKNLLV